MGDEKRALDVSTARKFESQSNRAAGKHLGN